jgi:hypothetical protein
MSESRNSGETRRAEAADPTARAADADAAEIPVEEAAGEPRQPPTLGPEEVARIAELEELEDFIEEPTEGPLSIISDQDVPGAPG